MQDIELLREYAASNSEEAFRTLVDRHIRPLLNREPELATAGPRSTGAGEAPPNPPRTRREMRFLHRGGKR